MPATDSRAPSTSPAPTSTSGTKGGYTVLARRYRSRDFDELVGQEPIARTLRNAIATDRVAHAYLFCGTRGVGKTSMARIFAQALNVTHATEPLAEAREIGAAILRGDDLDVIEIDGASNNGVQQARDLIAASSLLPARCRYRIYIIDEVHMLTTPAFNALLKTMEEPPPHVKFILCTTDPQKVPATIQSRCQRFDFRAIPTSVIAEQLTRILAEEGVAADDDLVHLVATLGQGSMRDALSLLDRLLAAGVTPLTVDLAEEMLGIPDHALVESVVDAIAAGTPDHALRATKELLERGATIEQALDLLTEHLRACLLVATCGPDTDLLEVSGSRREMIRRHAGAFDPSGLVYMMSVCDATARRARGASTARALLDAAIVRLCLTEQTAQVAELLSGAPAEKKKPADRRRVTPAPTGARPPNATPAAPPAPAPPGPALVEVKPAEITDAELWTTAVARAQKRTSDAALVADYEFADCTAGTLRLRIAAHAEERADFAARRAERVADLIERLVGRRVRVAIDGPADDGPDDTAPPRRTPRARAETLPPGAAMQLPLVRETLEIFGGTITQVRDAERPPAARPAPNDPQE